MEREEISVGDPIEVAGVTVVPIVHTRVSAQKRHGAMTCSALKHVLGIVVLTPTGRRALTAEGEEVPIEEYLHLAPALRSVLYPPTGQ